MNIPDMQSLNSVTVCLYCQTYQQIQSNYPVNEATFQPDSEVPRCEVHSQYTCDQCDNSVHFNGISFCNECSEFTCLQCGELSINEYMFLVYDYYYEISCKTCERKNSSLDYTETVGMHPYQIGGRRPEGNVRLWMPIGQDISYKPDLKAWGLTRLRNMASNVDYEPVEEVSGDSKDVWDQNAEYWLETVRKGDVNHLEIIIPQMMEYLKTDQRVIMDVACGEGTFTRKLSEAGYDVTGTDISNLIDYAIKTEHEQQLGIEYYKFGVHKLQQNFEENSYDQVTMNMAIMDIEDLDSILGNIAYILKPGGQFVFSLTHPVTAWPTVRTIKLPHDSQRNEDKGLLVDNYAAEQPMKIHIDNMPGPMLYYPRKISTYVNALLAHNFTITAMEEPVPDDEIIKKYPRDMYNDYDRNPIFMVVQTKLLE